MALDLKAVQVTVNEDETYNIYVQVVDTVTGKVLRQKTFTANTINNLKDQVRPLWTEFKAEYEEHQNLLSLANDAMDELEAE